MNLEIGYDLNTLLGSVALDYKLTFGDDVDGDTPMYWGDVASGTTQIEVLVQNGSVSLTETGRFYFNTMRADTTVFSSEHVTWTGTQKYARLSIYNGQFDFGGSTFVCSQENINDTSVLYAGTNIPTYNPFYSQNYHEDRLGKILNIDYTTSQQVHNQNPNIPYMPISGGEYTYNQIRNYVVNEYNEDNPEETITVDELPDIDGNLPTEETTEAVEPSYDIQPFSLDYGEILGEKEMESIIAETRYVLDTTPYEIESFDYMLEASAPYEILKDAGTLSDGLIASVGKVYDLADDVVPPEIISLYAFLAFLGVGMWFLLRR